MSMIVSPPYTRFFDAKERSFQNSPHRNGSVVKSTSIKQMSLRQFLLAKKLGNVAIPRFFISLPFVNLLNNISHQMWETGTSNEQEIIE